jgi:hypothetical protein
MPINRTCSSAWARRATSVSPSMISMTVAAPGGASAVPAPAAHAPASAAAASVTATRARTVHLPGS